MKVLIIGGTKFIGRHLVASLSKGGHEISVLHRRDTHDFGKKVVNIQADRNDLAKVRQAVGSQSFDAVYDIAYDWDRGTPASVIEGTARLLDGRAGRYIFMSSVAAYGDGLNHHEGDALAPDDHPEIYARNKAQSERALFRLHQRYGIPVTTIRPPYVYGPGNPFYREQFFWDRIRDKRPLILPGDGRRLMQFVYVGDLVWALVRALDVPATIGHAFNIANPRALTQAEVVDAFAAAAGKESKIVRIPRESIHRAGGHPMGPRLYFGMYFDLPPITMIISKAQRVLGLKPTSFGEGLKQTYKWYLRHHEKPSTDYAFENLLLAKASQLAS